MTKGSAKSNGVTENLEYHASTVYFFVGCAATDTTSKSYRAKTGNHVRGVHNQVYLLFMIAEPN